MVTLNPRQQFIVQTARDQGFVTVDELSEKLDVTPQTLRRDINFLCEKGVLSRFHGGAAIRSSVTNLPYEARRGSLSEEKKRIAVRVAAEIPNRSSVFIDIGTTAEAVALQLAGKSGLRILTNNLNVVRLLADKDDFEIIVTCGTVRPRDFAIAGAMSTAFIERFNVDVSILGVVAIDARGAILDFFVEEEPLTQAIIRCGRQSFVVADHSKFGRQAMARVAHVSEVSAVFTDALPDPSWEEVLARAGTRLVIA